MKETIYLYGFVPADTCLPQAGLAGIADCAVELLPAEGYAAVFSRVPTDLYGPAVVEARTRELRWVAEQGVAHERVAAWFVDHARILPAPLLTLYSSVAALAAQARERGDEIVAQLERFAGMREWDLKVGYDPATLAHHLAEASEEIADLDRRIAEASQGTRFLLERQRDERVREELGRTARRLASDLLDAVAAEATELRLLPLGRPVGELPVVLNAALLVGSETESRLIAGARARADALEALGMDVSLSGPWAPYRFLEAPNEGAPDE